MIIIGTPLVLITFSFYLKADYSYFIWNFLILKLFVNILDKLSNLGATAIVN